MKTTFTSMNILLRIFLLLSANLLYSQQPVVLRPLPKTATQSNTSNKPPCAQFAKYPRKVHAVLVGISDYTRLKKLSFCHKDAKAINSFLLSENANEELIGSVTLLTNENATKTKIMRAVEDMCRDAQPEDMLIFFFSGHGGETGLSHYAYDGKELIGYQWLKETMRKSPAQMKMMIIDACHSGAIKDAIYMGAVSDLLNNQYNKGLCMITASKSNEFSLEDRKNGMGYFTYYFLRGLRGGLQMKGVTKFKNCITLREAFNFAQVTVPIMTNNAQTPTLSGDIPENYVMWWTR